MGRNKIDKGFEFIYWKLSYRRKFIRTLWFFPPTVILAVFLFIKYELNKFVILVLIVTIYTTKSNFTKGTDIDMQGKDDIVSVSLNIGVCQVSCRI